MMKPDQNAGGKEIKLNPIVELTRSLTQFIMGKKDPLPLQFIRVTEKFDVVKRMSYKGWVLRRDSE
jgi:hypothetical protein